MNSLNPPKGSGDGHVKNTGYHDKKSYNKCGYGNYQSRAANVWEEPEEYWSDSLSEVES